MQGSLHATTKVVASNARHKGTQIPHAGGTFARRLCTAYKAEVRRGEAPDLVQAQQEADFFKLDLFWPVLSNTC